MIPKHSTKMLRSWLFLALVCIAHSPYSFGDTHKLDKRMAAVLDTTELGAHSEQAGRGSASAEQAATNLGPHTNPHPEVLSDPTARNPNPELTADPNQSTGGGGGGGSGGGPSGPNRGRRVSFAPQNEIHHIRDPPPPPPTRSSTKNPFKILRKKISNFLDNIRWFFGKMKYRKKSVGKSTRRALDEPFKGFNGLQKLSTMGEPQLDEKLKTIVKQISEKKFYVKNPTDPRLLFANLRPLLIKARNLNLQFSGARAELNANSEAILSNIREFLIPKRMRSGDPLARLGEQLSASSVKNLERDQETIYNKILLKDEKYLFNAFGILGPGNVLSHEVKVWLQEGVGSRTWAIAPHASADSIVQDMELLQRKLAAAVEWAKDLDNSVEEERNVRQIDLNLLLEIQQIGNKLDQSFHPPSSFLEVLGDIKNSDMYKSFQRDLVAPNSRAGYELQLIEPWGIARQLMKMRLQDLPQYSLNSVSSVLESLFTLQSQYPRAIRNARIRLDFSRRARAIEDKLRTILTPDGIAYLSRKI